MRRRLPRRNCLNCGKECSRPVKFYCNNKCQNDFKWLQVKAEIENSGEFKPTLNGKVARRYLIEKFGNTCNLCNLSMWKEFPIPLILDHIDGNSENWSLVNLRMVCPNCDALLPTFKGRNKGKGRATRRQRYAEGKSY